MVKSTHCSCKRTEFGSWHVYGCSQLSVTPDPENPVPSFGLHGTVCMRYIGMHAGNIQIHKIK